MTVQLKFEETVVDLNKFDYRQINKIMGWKSLKGCKNRGDCKKILENRVKSLPPPTNSDRKLLQNKIDQSGMQFSWYPYGNLWGSTSINGLATIQNKKGKASIPLRMTLNVFPYEKTEGEKYRLERCFNFDPNNAICQMYPFRPTPAFRDKIDLIISDYTYC